MSQYYLCDQIQDTWSISRCSGAPLWMNYNLDKALDYLRESTSRSAWLRQPEPHGHPVGIPISLLICTHPTRYGKKVSNTFSQVTRPPPFLSIAIVHFLQTMAYELF